jgi:release factor glutamine methyltransferase
MQPPEATFSALLQEVQRFWTPLPDKPEETAEGLLRALWSTASGAPVSVDRAGRAALAPLDAGALARLQQLIERRRTGVPLAHLTGRQTFLGLELLASPGALIPRKETEILGRAALAKIACMAEARGAVTVLDVCTGSGNLALAYAYYEPRAYVLASDLSPEAVALARRNCDFTGLAGRVEVRVGDLLEPFDTDEFRGRCDLVSCNPPYISAAKVREMHPEISRHEPQAAFDGGVYGVAILMKLLKGAPRLLRPGGWLGFEVGEGQGERLAGQLARTPAFSQVETHRDAGGQVRAILARTPDG